MGKAASKIIRYVTATTCQVAGVSGTQHRAPKEWKVAAGTGLGADNKAGHQAGEDDGGLQDVEEVQRGHELLPDSRAPSACTHLELTTAK